MESKLSNALLDMLPFGIAVLNAQGRILFANAYATYFLKVSDDLFAEEGVLRVRSVPHKRALSDALRAFARAVNQEPIGFSISRTEKRPVSIVLSSLARRSPDGTRSNANPKIALVLSDPHFHYPPRPSLVSDLYGLTPAESQIAVLMMESADTAAVAHKLGITRNTLRGHLKSIFLKTQTRNQGELLHTLLLSPLSLQFDITA